MAINTDLLIDISDEYDEPKYGVSKALSNYTLDEIWNSAYVGANFPVHRMITKSTGEAARYWSTDITRPYTIGSLIYQWGQYIGARIASSGAADDDEYAEDGIYSKTIWLYSASTIPQAVTDLTTVRMVTQMDFTRFKLKFTRTTGQSNGEGTPEWGDTKSYGTQKSNAYLLDNSDPNDPVWLESGNIMLIKPYQMIKVDDKYCIIDALTPYYTANYLGGFEADTPKEVVTGYATTDNSVKFGLLQSLKKTTDSYGEIRWYENSWSVNYPSMYDNYKAYMQNRSTSQGYNQTVVYPTTQNEFQKNIMGYGVYFQTDRTYKPIITDGYVTGYTDDLNAASELDGYTGSSIHVVPDSKPGGGGGGDTDQDSDWDDIAINGAGIGGGSAFCRFYYCTEAELANLRTWTMGLSEHGDPIPAGFDPKSNIIGLTVFPFTISGNGPTTIKFVTNGGIDPITTQEMPRTVDSGVACEGGAGATTRILNATIDVPSTMKTRGEPWLDYESYIELYIPLCGVYQVDPQVVIGRTINVEIFLDPVAGTVMGIAWVSKDGGKCIIAQGSGTPGVQIPVAVGNYGLAQAARVQNTLSGFTGTANSAISTTMVSNAFQNRAGERGLNGVRKISNPNTTAGSRIAAFNRSGGSAILGFSGLLSSAQHWVSARQIANSPGTSASGGFSGSMAEWCGVFTPYVKIVRPMFRKPDNYKHTCGEPEVTERTLKSTGYAICINPDISGLTNATEAERAAIYQYLSTGVYYK